MKTYFPLSDRECPCCNRENLSPIAHKKFDQARELAGIPFIMNSMCRCWDHNKSIGGSPTSSHLIEKEDGTLIESYAGDIKYENSHQAFLIVRGLLLSGCVRILIYKTFIHADFDPHKSQEIFKRM